MLGLAIARLLHTVFVADPQKCPSSVITGLFTGPLKDVKCSTLLSNLTPPTPQFKCCHGSLFNGVNWLLNTAHLAFQALLVLCNLVLAESVGAALPAGGVAPAHRYRHPNSIGCEIK